MLLQAIVGILLPSDQGVAQDMMGNAGPALVTYP